MAAAAELGASHIVVGAANGGLRGRHRLGSVATELLHSSDVPGRARPGGVAPDRPGDRRDPHHGGDRHAPGRRRAARGGDVARRRRQARSCACSRSSRSTCRQASTPASSGSPVQPTPTRCSRRRARRTAGVSDAEVIVGRGDSIEDAVAALELGAGRGRDRRLQPARPAAAALPRLDRCEDAS